MRARGPRARTDSAPTPVDYAGAGLLVVLTVLLAVLLDRRMADTIGTPQKGVMALVLAATLIGFVARERSAPDPIVNFALFRIRMFTVSVLSLLLTATANTALALLMPFYLQDVLHLSPSFIGLIFLTAPVFTILCAAVTGPLTDWIGPRVPTSIGIVMTMAAFLVGWLLTVDSHWMVPTVVMGLVGLGTGFFNTPNQTAILGSVPRAYRGFAAGMIQTVFGMSSLVGTSLTGVLLTVLFRRYTGQPDRRPGPEDPLAFVASMNGIYLACAGLMVVALAASAMRGGARIEAPAAAGRE
jgi:MFS family permease